MRNLIEDKIKKRTDTIVNIFDEFINRGDRVLDIGAGGGWIGGELKRRKKTEVTLLDIIDFNQTDLELILYDQKNIPFPDNYFNTSLLIFTLHHCLNPLRVLEEAKRVSKEKIIIIEDIPTSLINRIFLCIWDIWSGLPSLIKPPGENIVFKFKTISGWKKILENLQLKITFQKRFHLNKLIHHELFVVQKC